MSSICATIALSDQAVARAFCFCLPTSLQQKVVGKMPLLYGASSAPLFDLTLGSVARKGHFVMTSKRCTKCGKIKPLNEFRRRRKVRDGRASWCKICCANYDQAYHQKHKSQRAANNRAYRIKNLERLRVLEQQYNEQHREQRAVYACQYRQDNHDKIREAVHLRRAREANAEGSFTLEEFNQLVIHCGNQCLCCRYRFTDENPTVADHIVPLSRGGVNSISNIQPLCGRCNRKKMVKTTDYRKKERMQCPFQD